MADYIVDGKPDFYSTGMKYFEWTTTPPTVEGWYWVKPRYLDDSIEPYIVEAKQGKAYVTGDDQPDDFDMFSHWLGPLPVPEPPQIDA